MTEGDAMCTTTFAASVFGLALNNGPLNCSTFPSGEQQQCIETNRKAQKCYAVADAAAADDYAAMRTPPKARSLLGGGIVGTLFGVATKSNPLGWLAGAAMTLRDNIGGAIVGTIKWEDAYEACAVAP